MDLQDPTKPTEDVRYMPAAHVIAVTLLALLIGLLLNAPDILATAQRQEEGWKRQLGVAAAKPFDWMSRSLALDRPHNVIDSALGREASEPSQEPTPTTPITANPTSSEATTTTSPVLARRQITATDPLRMFIGGDSLVGQFGPMLENEADKTGLVDVTEVIYEFDSGLTRVDFLDWPARLRQVGAIQDPEAMVLFFGGNDAQAIEIDGTWYDFGTDEWLTEYRRRVGGLMEELVGEGRDVYWVGLPIVRSESFREKVAVMNEIYSSEAERIDGVTFIDSWSVFTGPDGGFSEYLTDDDGDLIDMRLNDGIHLTTAGGIRLAKVVMQSITENWRLG